MKCKIIDGWRVTVNNPVNPEITDALYIKAVPCTKVETNTNLVDEDDDTFLSTAFNQSTFEDVYHTILFPINETVMEALLSLCDDDGYIIPDNPQLKKIHLLKVNTLAPEPYYQVFTKNSVDAKGVEDGRYSIGDYVPDDKGQPKLFTEIQVVVVCDKDENPLENVVRKAKQRWSTNIIPNKNGIQVFVPKSEYDALQQATKVPHTDGEEQAELPRPFARGARPART